MFRAAMQSLVSCQLTRHYLPRRFFQRCCFFFKARLLKQGKHVALVFLHAGLIKWIHSKHIAAEAQAISKK